MQQSGLLALLATIITLIATLNEVQQSKTVREATLFALAMERIESARIVDKNKKATSTLSSGIRKCTSGKQQLSARTGQIPILERMVRLRISLRDIAASDVNLVVARKSRDTELEYHGIDLEEADLFNADLQNTNLRFALLTKSILTRAQLNKSCLRDAILIGANLVDADIERVNFSGGDLSNSDLSGADLYRTNLANANLAGAVFDNTDITATNFRSVTGLTQTQLNRACAEIDEPPINLPKVHHKVLKWNPRTC